MAIIPAHNEEDGIEKTIRSLLRQEPAPSVVLVMADNWVHVLSGAATMFPAGVLRHNERACGNELPGRRLPPQHRWCARRADGLRFLPRRHRAPQGADPAGRGNLLPEAPGLHRPPPVLPGGGWRCTAGPSSAGATVPWGQSWCCCS
ncbi:hypothetical protein BN11_1450004 [Nostocoides australiense Ben110]|uniref:Uncharacterized protein n=1 Tax=Nostocoides australiense Ben110 TaxID=1193182 RepID=W6JSV2_9MICO|nr:hypothetical protein BN11_1450004 [Tetrasphaera australiensis Ben110]